MDHHDYRSAAESTAKSRCHYCQLPLRRQEELPAGGYYRRPLQYNQETCTFDYYARSHQVWGHPACMMREMLTCKLSNVNRELHVLHEYLREEHRYFHALVPSPPREMLPGFCTPAACAQLTPAHYGEIIQGQLVQVDVEYEPFFVPAMHVRNIHVQRDSSSSAPAVAPVPRANAA